MDLYPHEHDGQEGYDNAGLMFVSSDIFGGMGLDEEFFYAEDLGRYYRSMLMLDPFTVDYTARQCDRSSVCSKAKI